MTQLEIESLLIKVLMEVQSNSGRAVVAITSDMSPLDDLEDFDSLNGVEVTVEIFEKIQLDLEFNNVFVQDEKSLSIKEAASRIHEQATKVAK